ncbi:hypothetical protein QBZ16_004984 [Prototheca wickerhamii]|uniref:Matrin-type domain-containing protein n=1 Tax=Prototheca wickerhamii TaxID=3111 RepID=A0AAD9IHI6_PROWI|nr:hypothetical protein QBZ16_004984 [Prototheca wickerhamii]
MTEFWKSQAMYWCDICKVWLKDDAQAKAVHERGAKHQENVAKRLRDMRRRAEEEKKSEAQLATTMKNIEQAAAAQFSRDKDEELRYRKATLGEWVLNTESGYHYNALHRWRQSCRNQGPPPDPKKKRKIDKSLPPEEREALLRREAARARVEKRTMATFGLQ